MTQEQKAEHDYDRAKDESAERHGDDVAAILRHEYEAHWFMHQNDPRLARVQYQKIVDRLAYAHEYSRWSTSRMPEGSHERGYLSEYQRLRKENKRLRDVLEAIANDFDEWGDTIARYTMYNVARTALQEDDNDTQ